MSSFYISAAVLNSGSYIYEANTEPFPLSLKYFYYKLKNKPKGNLDVKHYNHSEIIAFRHLRPPPER